MKGAGFTAVCGSTWCWLRASARNSGLRIEPGDLAASVGFTAATRRPVFTSRTTPTAPVVRKAEDRAACAVVSAANAGANKSRKQTAALVRIFSEPRTPGVPHPRFPEEIRGFANFMRLSLEKGAHADLSGVSHRKSGHLARFSRDVGFRGSIPASIRGLLGTLKGGNSRAVVSHISRKTSEMWGTQLS